MQRISKFSFSQPRAPVLSPAYRLVFPRPGVFAQRPQRFNTNILTSRPHFRPSTSETNPSTPTNDAKPAEERIYLEDWTEADVEAWMRKYGWRPYLSKFKGFNGKQLAQMTEVELKKRCDNVVMGAVLHMNFKDLKQPTQPHNMKSVLKWIWSDIKEGVGLSGKKSNDTSTQTSTADTKPLR